MDPLQALTVLFTQKYGMSQADAERQARYYVNSKGGMAQSFLQEANQMVADKVKTAKVAPGQGMNMTGGTVDDLNRAAALADERNASIRDVVSPPTVFVAAKPKPHGKKEPVPKSHPVEIITTDVPGRVADAAGQGATKGQNIAQFSDYRLPPAPLTPQTMAMPAAPTPAHDEDADLSTWQRYHDLLFSSPATRGSP
jgi:hypothetical protein